MNYFNFEKVACEAGIPPDKLLELKQLIRREFPRDEMMYELHVLRACMAIRDGVISLAEALRAEPAAK
jgi:hypothetical protein